MSKNDAPWPKGRKEPAKPTVKAVVAFAQALRQRAEMQKARAYWSKPYSPSEAVARKLSSQYGPEGALEVLAGRAKMAEIKYREESEIADRSLERHKRRHREAERDRHQQRHSLTVGQRLDKALAAFSVIPAAGAAQVGWSTKGSDKPGLTKHGDPAAEAKYLALKMVREIEGLLDNHQRRDVDKAA